MQKVINVLSEGRSVEEAYKNFMIAQVNESCLRLAVFQGDYPWHSHPFSDELFMVVEGELVIEFRDSDAVVLNPFDVFLVPRGTVHRTRASVRTANLCFEHDGCETKFI